MISQSQRFGHTVTTELGWEAASPLLALLAGTQTCVVAQLSSHILSTNILLAGVFARLCFCDRSHAGAAAAIEATKTLLLRLVGSACS